MYGPAVVYGLNHSSKITKSAELIATQGMNRPYSKVISQSCGKSCQFGGNCSDHITKTHQNEVHRRFWQSEHGRLLTTKERRDKLQQLLEAAFHNGKFHFYARAGHGVCYKSS